MPSSVVKATVDDGPCASSIFHGLSESGFAGAAVFDSAASAAADDTSAAINAAARRVDTKPPGLWHAPGPAQYVRRKAASIQAVGRAGQRLMRLKSAAVPSALK